jgi:hypothetical protein
VDIIQVNLARLAKQLVPGDVYSQLLNEAAHYGHRGAKEGRENALKGCLLHRHVVFGHLPVPLVYDNVSRREVLQL